MFSKKVSATICRSDKFNSFQKCVETFEFIRSTKVAKIFVKNAMWLLKNVVENKVRIQGGQFWKNALNLVLIADPESTQKNIQNRTRIIDLQNDFNIFVAKQWKMIISVPTSYINNLYKKKTIIIIKQIMAIIIIKKISTIIIITEVGQSDDCEP